MHYMSISSVRMIFYNIFITHNYFSLTEGKMTIEGYLPLDDMLSGVQVRQFL